MDNHAKRLTAAWTPQQGLLTFDPKAISQKLYLSAGSGVAGSTAGLQQGYSYSQSPEHQCIHCFHAKPQGTAACLHLKSAVVQKAASNPDTHAYERIGQASAMAMNDGVNAYCSNAFLCMLQQVSEEDQEILVEQLSSIMIWQCCVYVCLQTTNAYR